MATRIRIIERSKGLIDITIPRHPGITRYRLSGQVTLDGAFTAPTIFEEIPAGTVYQSISVQKAGLGLNKLSRPDSSTRMMFSMDDFGPSATLPGDLDFLYLTIQEFDTASASWLPIVQIQSTGSITVTAPGAGGNTITIGGIVLAGVAGARTPGSNDFNATIATNAGLAIEIANAINDPGNSFTGTVSAVASGGVVSLTAIAPGTAGDLVALLTNAGGVYALSGANLTGGADGDDTQPIFVIPPSLSTAPGTPSLTLAGKAPGLTALPGFPPPSGSMHIVLPGVAKQVNFINNGGVDLGVCFDERGAMLKLPSDFPSLFSNGRIKEIFLAGAGASDVEVSIYLGMQPD